MTETRGTSDRVGAMKPKPRRVFTKSLRVRLTEDERRNIAVDLAGEQGRLEAARVMKEELVKEHASIIKKHEAEVGALASTVNSGFLYREVECHEVDDFDGKRVIQVRVDTSEIIDERPMNEEERQRPLPIE